MLSKKMYKIKFSFLFLVLQSKTKNVHLVNPVKFNLFSFLFLFFTPLIFVQEKTIYFNIPVF